MPCMFRDHLIIYAYRDETRHTLIVIIDHPPHSGEGTYLNIFSSPGFSNKSTKQALKLRLSKCMN